MPGTLLVLRKRLQTRDIPTFREVFSDGDRQWQEFKAQRFIEQSMLWRWDVIRSWRKPCLPEKTARASDISAEMETRRSEPWVGQWVRHSSWGHSRVLEVWMIQTSWGRRDHAEAITEGHGKASGYYPGESLDLRVIPFLIRRYYIHPNGGNK